MIYVKHKSDMFLQELLVAGYINEEDIIDISDIPGVYGICSLETIAKISKRIKDKQSDLIYYLGSGNFHYLTYAIAKNISQDFVLVVFDHHVDASQFAPGFMNCGSWIENLLSDNKHVYRVFIVGADQESGENRNISLAAQRKISYIYADDFSKQTLANEILPYAGQNLYISIDRDVLAEEVMTNWDQGEFTVNDLLAAIDIVCQKLNLIQADICGDLEWDWHDYQDISNRRYWNKSLIVNQKLIQALTNNAYLK